MLEVGDKNDPVVDPEVRNTPVESHLSEAALVGPEGGTGNGEEEAKVGPNNLPLVVLAEDDGLGVEVYSCQPCPEGSLCEKCDTTWFGGFRYKLLK